MDWSMNTYIHTYNAKIKRELRIENIFSIKLLTNIRYLITNK